MASFVHKISSAFRKPASTEYGSLSRPAPPAATVSDDKMDMRDRSKLLRNHMSFHDIVVPRPKPWTPFLLRPFVVTVVVGILVGLAVGTEVLLSRSNAQNGLNIDAFDEFGSTQLLKSFIPAIITLPIIWLVKKVGSYVTRLQPYVELAKGNASARKSVLLDYSHSNPYKVLFASLLRFQGIVIVTSFIAIMIPFSQSLAASMLLVRYTGFNETTRVNTSGAIGLNPEVNLLSPFVAASGFVDAAIAGNFGDPPFVLTSWAIPSFEPAKPRTDRSLTANLTATVPGVNAEGVCTNASSTTTKTDTGYTLSATLPQTPSCNFSVNIDSQSVAWQSGVSVLPATCVQAINANLTALPADVQDEFKPVVFWVFTYNEALSSVTFCAPYVDVQNIDAVLDVTTDIPSLVAVQLSATNYTGTNNVTGKPLNGLAYNGVGFSNVNADKFVKARAVVAPATLATAVLRAGRLSEGGLAATMKNQTAFPTLVKEIYTRFLAISASSIYFTEADAQLPGILTLGKTRLWVDPFAAHSFATMMAFTAILLVIIHIQHYFQRRKLFIASEPGSLAAAATVISHSRFATSLINANDDEDSLEQKLKGMKFGFDSKTWQVESDRNLVDDYAVGNFGDRQTPYHDESPLPYNSAFPVYQTSPPGSRTNIRE